MSDRELRKSTRDASERRKQREEARELLKEIKKRRASYPEVIAELDAQIDESEVVSNSSLLSNTVDWDFENSDSESEFIEPLRVVESPEKNNLSSEASQTQGHSPSPGSWSTVNKFFPDGCEITPVNQVLSSTSRSVAHSLPSPRLNLEPIVETELDEVFDQQQQNPSNMDADTYKGKLLLIKSEIAKVDRKWQAYTKEDVEVVIDPSECLAKLQKIEDAEESCQDKIFELIYELDEDAQADEVRVKSLRSMSDELRKRVKTNSKEVKSKMAEILIRQEENKPMSAADKKAMELKEKKMEDDKKAVLKEVELKSKDCRELTAALDKERKIEEMSEQEIRQDIVVKVKDWKSKISKLADIKNELSVKLVRIQLDVSEQEDVQSFERDFEKAEKDVTERIEDLLKMDKELGLYS